MKIKVKEITNEEFESLIRTYEGCKKFDYEIDTVSRKDGEFTIRFKPIILSEECKTI